MGCRKNPNERVLLRNCVTFVLRQAVAHAEREYYYAPSDSLHTIKRIFRKILEEEVFLASLCGTNQSKGAFVARELFCITQLHLKKQMMHVLSQRSLIFFRPRLGEGFQAKFIFQKYLKKTF